MDAVAQMYSGMLIAVASRKPSHPLPQLSLSQLSGIRVVIIPAINMPIPSARLRSAGKVMNPCCSACRQPPFESDWLWRRLGWPKRPRWPDASLGWTACRLPIRGLLVAVALRDLEHSYTKRPQASPEIKATSTRTNVKNPPISA